MKRSFVVSSLVNMLVFGIWMVNIASAQTDFSGTWVLDKDKTSNLPPQLESYTMVVAQNDQQLTVENKMFGDFRPGGGPVDGGRGRGGRPPGVGPVGGRGPVGGVRALGMLIPTATYKLDGTETTAKLDGPVPGTATLKAHWEEDGKVLELSTVQNLNFQSNKVAITSKERWELSEDGGVLKVQRTVESPRGSETTKLIFNKKGRGPEGDDQEKEAVENDPAAEAWAQVLEQLMAVKNKILRDSAPQPLTTVDKPALPTPEELSEGSNAATAETANGVITPSECGGPSVQF